MLFNSRRRKIALRGRALRRLHKVPASAVVGGDRKDHALAARGLRLTERNGLSDFVGEGATVADHTKAHALFRQGIRPLFETSRKKLHEHVDFRLGTTPVFRRKGKNRECGKTQFAGAAHDLLQGLDALAVPFGAGQKTLFGPPSVAVHDDGDVTRRRSIGHEENPSDGFGGVSIENPSPD